MVRKALQGNIPTLCARQHTVAHYLFITNHVQDAKAVLTQEQKLANPVQHVNKFMGI